MQSLMNGSDCSTGSSPLAGLLKQQNQDHSLHQQSFQGHPGASTSSLRSRPGGITPSHDEADAFFQAQSRGAQQQGAGPSNFAMDGLRRELEGVARDKAINGDREWASQYHPASSSLSPADVAHMEEQFRQSRANELSAEYWRMQNRTPDNAPTPPQASMAYHQVPSFNPTYSGSYGMNGMMGGMRMGGMSSMNQGAYEQSAVQDKGKGRFVELDDADWEAQFAKAGATVETKPQEVKAETEMVQPETVNLLEGDMELEANQADADLLESLESTWKNLQSTLNTASVSDAEMAAWEAQYGSQFNNLDGDSMLGDDLREAGAPTPWTKDNVDTFLANEAPFPFATENSYIDHPDPFAEGQRLLAAGAPLSEAALAFEAACRMDGTRAEAWRAAGETWAADEREIKGIRALEKAVSCGGPDAVSAWLSLAVAYVNEGQELRALATLERWLSLAYPTIQIPPITSVGPWDASARVIDLFLSAARSGPAGRVSGQTNDLTDIDPDVQVGLGVLFYSNSDYDRARDCFEAALGARPNDFLLWNRLGATLANGGHPENAIDAYRRALDLRPTFTRATYNLGVSSLNLGCYHEAAEHLLAALEGQMNRRGSGLSEADGGVDDDGSTNLWHTLRRAFLCLERHDLAELAQSGTDLSVFRAEGFEF